MATSRVSRFSRIWWQRDRQSLEEKRYFSILERSEFFSEYFTFVFIYRPLAPSTIFYWASFLWKEGSIAALLPLLRRGQERARTPQEKKVLVGGEESEKRTRWPVFDDFLSFATNVRLVLFSGFWWLLLDLCTVFAAVALWDLKHWYRCMHSLMQQNWQWKMRVWKRLDNENALVFFCMVCVCEREKERERESITNFVVQLYPSARSHAYRCKAAELLIRKNIQQAKCEEDIRSNAAVVPKGRILSLVGI